MTSRCGACITQACHESYRNIIVQQVCPLLNDIQLSASAGGLGGLSTEQGSPSGALLRTIMPCREPQSWTSWGAVKHAHTRASKNKYRCAAQIQRDPKASLRPGPRLRRFPGGSVLSSLEGADHGFGIFEAWPANPRVGSRKSERRRLATCLLLKLKLGCIEAWGRRAAAVNEKRHRQLLHTRGL